MLYAIAHGGGCMACSLQGGIAALVCQHVPCLDGAADVECGQVDRDVIFILVATRQYRCSAIIQLSEQHAAVFQRNAEELLLQCLGG